MNQVDKRQETATQAGQLAQRDKPGCPGTQQGELNERSEAPRVRGAEERVGDEWDC